MYVCIHRHTCVHTVTTDTEYREHAVNNLGLFDSRGRAYRTETLTTARTSVEVADVGTLVRWYIGTLVHWYVGTLVHWHVGTLVRLRHTTLRRNLTGKYT